ncbi:MAG: HAMP domain-containing sensor histidine kinase [Candidatus Binatia bacterium]|nr:HAMP domain-containing sensor histidine kinase [Candidatus Binatia bacterium]
MRRLYHQIYFAFVAITLLLIAVAVIPDWVYRSRRPPPRPITAAARMVAGELPATGPELQQSLDQQADRLGLDATIWTADGTALASTGEQVGPPVTDRGPAHWIRRPGPPGLAVRLEDGRWLALSLRHDDFRSSYRWPVGLLVFAGIVALGALPLSRRITRRLERLRAGVEKLGAGDLSARVAVEGRDEVAELATSFNNAAERIDSLVGTQRRMLASASHELRTPLARLRVAVELLSARASPGLRDEAAADIGELDEVIEDLLQTAQLEGAPAKPREPVELLGILAEEGAHLDANTSGETTVVQGDPRLLRRLIRNLLQNAQRHGGGSKIEASVHTLGQRGGRIEIADRGPGVRPEDRERIFEAFYRSADHSEGRDGGVGLGLALVREIARHHGGDALCLERPGGGTIVRVDLS